MLLALLSAALLLILLVRLMVPDGAPSGGPHLSVAGHFASHSADHRTLDAALRIRRRGAEEHAESESRGEREDGFHVDVLRLDLVDQPEVASSRSSCGSPAGERYASSLVSDETISRTARHPSHPGALGDVELEEWTGATRDATEPRVFPALRVGAVAAIGFLMPLARTTHEGGVILRTRLHRRELG